MIPWVDFKPDWLGWRSLGLSPDTIGTRLDRARRVPEALLQFDHHRRSASSALAVMLGCARRLWPVAVLLQIRLDAERRHLVLLPVAADPAARRARPAVPGPLQGAGASRHADRPDPALHADRCCPSSSGSCATSSRRSRPSWKRPRWSMACRSGARSSRIILPIALPGMVAAFILSLVLTWNEYFFAALLTSTHANTLPVMVASQTGRRASTGGRWRRCHLRRSCRCRDRDRAGALSSSRAWRRGR